MDNLFRHTLPLSRQFPHPLTLSSFGAYARKKDKVDHTFNSLNFSFILSGKGYYKHKSKSYEINAPCIIMQYPGVHQIYAPHDSWEEYYFIFPADNEALFEKMNFSNRKQPIIEIRKTARLLKQLNKMYDFCSQKNPSGDEVDLLAHQTLLEALTSLNKKEQESRIQQLQHFIEQNCHTHINFSQLAKDYSFSSASMHREWKKLKLPSPQQYQNQLRIEKACRLLAEENLHIQDIAFKLGFEDPLYFSRVFKKQSGSSPRQYRKTHANKNE